MESAPENICLTICPAIFPGAQSASHLLHPELLQGVWNVSSCSGQASDLILIDVNGKCPWQVPIVIDRLK